MVPKALEQIKDREYRIVPIDSIDIWNEANVRHTEITAGIDELAESIAKIGLQQPPIVQEVEKGKYKLIVGQRRLLAFQRLGRKEIPVLVQKVPYDLPQATLASLSENLHRKAVVASDLAYACEYLSKHFGSDKEAAKVIGISISTFKKYLGYRAVPEELKKLVSEKAISVSDSIRLSQIVSNVPKAVQFAKTISQLPKLTRERYFAALIEEPTDSLPSIKARADRSQYKTVIKIHLPETYAHALSRASTDSRMEPEAIAQKAVMEWLDRSGYVK
jgi:ParB family chromosome partitioning protein